MRVSWNGRRTRPKSGLRDWDEEAVCEDGSTAEKSVRVDQSCRSNSMIVPMIQVRHQLKVRNMGEATISEHIGTRSVVNVYSSI